MDPRAARGGFVRGSLLAAACGNVLFFPNTTGTFSYDATTPDPMVLSACEN